MRGSFVGGAVVLLIGTGLLLAAPVGRLAPKDIETLFFTGKPFTAATTSNVKYKMVFSPNGTMTREPMKKVRRQDRRHLEAFSGRLLFDLDGVEGELLSGA